MRVETTTGIWQVHRRWTPRQLRPDSMWQRLKNRSRFGRKALDGASGADATGCGIDLIEGIFAVIFLILIIVLLFAFAIPLLIAVVELLFLTVVIILGIASKVLFRRPWVIDATSPDGDVTEWRVVGWRKSAMTRDYVAHQIRLGAPVPSQMEVDAAIVSV